VDERAIPRRALNRLAFCRQRARTHICLRWWFSQFGERSAIYGTVRVRVEGTATAGDHLVIEGYDAKVSIKVAPGATLTIADDVYLNGGVSIEVFHEVRIGSNVLMAPYSSVIDDDRHEVEPGAVRYKGPVTIGNNVWLGRNVAVLPGVTIGDGAVVGANAVVARDIPPACFAAGAPARVIRKLDLPDGWVRR
jgi:acetyltransferase-like isoleucine patch superfamily enzyme